jgi:hypothetical protein
MKTEYQIKDKVWIHIGEPLLVEGIVVHSFILEKFPKNKLYIIEIKTGIDDVYEVRDWGQISNTADGPINLWEKLEVRQGARYFKKVGMVLPVDVNDEKFDDPSPDEINAATDRTVSASKTDILNRPKKKHFYRKRSNQVK